MKYKRSLIIAEGQTMQVPKGTKAVGACYEHGQHFVILEGEDIKETEEKAFNVLPKGMMKLVATYEADGMEFDVFEINE